MLSYKEKEEIEAREKNPQIQELEQMRESDGRAEARWALHGQGNICVSG